LHIKNIVVQCNQDGGVSQCALIWLLLHCCEKIELQIVAEKTVCSTLQKSGSLVRQADNLAAIDPKFNPD